MNKIICGNSLEVLLKATPNSIDSIVTDPPYGLSFMGKKWDYDVPSKEIWEQCLRVLKPGGYLLAFAGTRTQHRMAVNIEDAGFEIRDMIAWVYGSGFPKSLNIGKSIDSKLTIGSAAKNGFHKLEGKRREGRIGMYDTVKEQGFRNINPNQLGAFEHNPTTDEAKKWAGWGTALKPALEPITVARKPLSEKTVAENVLKWGTGGINIDGSRVGTETLGGGTMPDLRDVGAMSKEAIGIDKQSFGQNTRPALRKEQPIYEGRFPANLIHDGSDEVNDLLNDSARFFYCAKASKADRDEGLEGFEEIRTGGMQATADGSMLTGSGNERTTKRANHHPTVKPTKLMQYLVKLVTPKGGVVLDPFMGSGSTGKACKLEGFDFIGIELDPEYCKIAEARINAI